MSEKDREQEKRPPAEKPISLAGAKFKDVLRALLQTRPMPKAKQKPDQREG